MTDTRKENVSEEAGAVRTQPAGDTGGDSIHLYESSGVIEREGHVPMWLWIVVAVLVIWSIYYLVVYWNVPAPT